MFDHMAGDDPGELLAGDEFVEGLARPDVVHLFDGVDIDTVRCIFVPKGRRVEMVENADIEAIPLGRDGPVTRADFEPGRGLVDPAEDDLFAGFLLDSGYDRAYCAKEFHAALHADRRGRQSIE